MSDTPCIGSKVNGRLVPLDTRLESGDKVEILTSKVEGAGPSRDWLKFVASRRASNKIKQWYSQERREDAIEQGRDDLVQALRREGLPARRILKEAGVHRRTRRDELRRRGSALRGDR